MGCVLVPLDGSECARVALPHAAGLARRLGAEVALLGVAEGWYSGDPLPDPREEIEALGGHLEEQARRLREQGLIVRLLERSGAPAEEILRAGVEADLIVMSSHGRTGFGRWLLGGVTARVMREAEAPVMVVRPLGDGFEGARYRRILVPLDGSEYSERAVPPARFLAHCDRAQLCLLRVVDRPTWIAAWQGDLESTLERVDGELRNRAQRLVGDTHRVITECVTGAAAERILDVAEGGFDLVVMATHGHRWGDRKGLGSTAERVVHHARCPVLLVRGVLKGDWSQ